MSQGEVSERSSLGELFRESFAMVKHEPLTAIAGTMVPFLISILPFLFFLTYADLDFAEHQAALESSTLDMTALIQQLLVAGIFLLFAGFVTLVATSMAAYISSAVWLELYRYGVIEAETLTSLRPRLPRVITASTIKMGMISLGNSLCVFPGMMVAAGLLFHNHILVDHDVSAHAALRKSWDMTKGRKKDYLVPGLCIIGLNILGFALFGLGLFITMPVSQGVITLLYIEQGGERGSRPTSLRPTAISKRPVAKAAE